MRPSDGSVTSSRFERRLPAGQHDLLFKVVFGSDAKAARARGVSRMQVWRWRHDRSPLPRRLAEWLVDRVQLRVMEAHEAQNQLRYFLELQPIPSAHCQVPVPDIRGNCA